MFLLYNGQFILEEELRFPLSNRAFQYNDGFFETIILENDKLRFWPDHQARMQEAAALLQFDLPPELLAEDFPRQLVRLSHQNRCGKRARIKLKVWRAGQGLYAPQTDKADWFVTAQSTLTPGPQPLRAGICQSVQTVPSAFSSFKGSNTLVYILASREKINRGLDDVIILDPKGYLAELTSSNLFWIKGNTLYTPGLETGCVHGVMRRKLIREFIKKGGKVEEGSFLPATLQEAEIVFAGNVTGLRAINMLENESLVIHSSLLDELKKITE